MQKRHSIILIIALLLVYSIDSWSQDFTATQSTSDAHIDIDWSLDVDPCLLDTNGEEYNRIRVKLLADGTELYQEILEGDELDPYYGPEQPDFDYMVKKTYGANRFLTFLPSGNQNFTAEIWVRNNDLTVEEKFFSDGNVRGIGYEGNELVYYADENSSETIGVLNINQGEWYHVAMSNDINSGKIKIYINGTYLTEVADNWEGSGLLLMETSSSSAFADTDIGGIRLWDNVRNDSQIDAFYLFDDLPSQTNLIGEWYATSNSMTPDQATDYDGIQNNLILVLSPTFDYLPFIATPYSPLVGTYRHVVGPNQNVDYTLRLQYGPFAQSEMDCDNLSATGSTSADKEPIYNATTNFNDRINVSIQNTSDLADRYDVIRDDTLTIATYFGPFEVGQMFELEDVFQFGEENSIQSEVSHKYELRKTSSIANQVYTYGPKYGNTRETSFDAYTIDNQSVNCSWDIPGGYAAKYELWRNDNRIAVLPQDADEYVDLDPTYGDLVTYELRAIDDTDTVRIQVFRDIAIDPNGEINGRVLSSDQFIPIALVQVKATRKSNNEVYTSTTNSLGQFQISDVSYGILDSFILEATAAGHEFYYPQPVVSLNKLEPVLNDLVIIDSLSYGDGSATLNITSFDVEAQANLDKVDISWSANSSEPRTFTELTRNGQYLFVDQDNFSLNNSFLDIDGVPGQLAKYTFRIFKETPVGSVSIDTETITIEYPQVSVFATEDFTVAEQEDINGNGLGKVIIQWNESSQYIDGYLIYRNGEEIAELGSEENVYIDDEALYGVDYVYTIAKTRIVGSKTYTGQETASSLFNLGMLDSPISIQSTPMIDEGYVLVDWDTINPQASDFNITGYYIYRDDAIVGVSIYGQETHFRDMTGQDLTYTYGVSAFKIFEDTIVQSAILYDQDDVQYPPVPPAHNFSLTGTPTTNSLDSKEVLLEWVPSEIAVNYDGWMLLKNGTFNKFIPQAFNEHLTVLDHNEGALFTILAYKNQDGIIRVSVPNSGGLGAITYPSKIIPNPENVTASASYPNAVKVCWEYDPFIAAEFIIYHNNVAIDTVSTETRSYFHFTDFEPNPSYAVKAYYDGELTPNVEESYAIRDIGKLNKRTLIYGQLIESNTNQGIPLSQIQISVDSGPYQYVTTTDLAGFYSIDLDRYSDSYDVQLKVSPGTCFDCLTSTVQINPIDTTYNHDLYYDLSYDPIVEDVAQVEHINGFSNSYLVSSYIYWNMSSDNYDGIDVIKGIEPLAVLNFGDKLAFEDKDGVPGIPYRYILTPYKIIDSEKISGESVSVDVVFPKLLPVEELKATPISKLNRVEIEWGHTLNNVDNYLVLRNGDFFADIISSDVFKIIDTTGLPGETYQYEVYASKFIDGTNHISEVMMVSAVFPQIGKVYNLESSAPFFNNVPRNIEGTAFYQDYYKNYIQLDWDYDDDQAVGFKIYRNGLPIDIIDGSERSYVDYSWAPGLPVEYDVSPLILRNNKEIEGKRSSTEIDFPILSPVMKISKENRTDVGDIGVTFEYNVGGADGFRVYRIADSENDWTLVKDIKYEFDPSVVSQQFSFYDSEKPELQMISSAALFAVETYKVVDGAEYTSEWNYTAFIGPTALPPVETYTVSDAFTYSGEEHMWTVSDDRYIDGYKIYEQDKPWVLATIPANKRYAKLALDVDLLESGSGDDYKGFEIATYRNIDDDGNFIISNKVSGLSDFPDNTYVENQTSGTLETAFAVNASDGTLDFTKITWELDCLLSGCNYGNVSDWYIYRDGERIGSVAPDVYEFIDDPVNLSSNASFAIEGKEYIYEVSQSMNYNPSVYYALNNGDIGYSSREGRIEGNVYLENTTVGVNNVLVTVVADDVNGGYIEESAYTLADGSFSIDNLYVPDSSIVYDFEAEYLDHEFNILSGTVLLTPNNSVSTGSVIYDLSATVVNGTIKKQNALCGLPNIKVLYQRRVSGVLSTVDSVFTDSEGFYSLVIDPNVTNLEEIIIKADNIEIEDNGVEGQKILHDFTPQIFNNFINFPSTSTVDFTDELTYPVNLVVENACGDPISDQPVQIEVTSLDQCYYQLFETNLLGEVVLDLPPLDYQITVKSIVGSGLDNYENAAKNYLELRPTTLEVFQVHYDANGVVSDSIFEPKMIYHRAPEFVLINDFNRFLCDDPTDLPIIEQGSNISLGFTITEEHLGEDCEVSDGYIKVRNAAAIDPLPDPIIHNGNTFPSYTWVAGGPNLIAPHVHSLSVQYFNDSDIFQGEIDMGLIVEGSAQLPGTGIQTVPAEDGGEVNLPLFVLRDPPGDASYTELASGTSVSQTLTMSKSSANSGGFSLDGNVAGGVVALFGAFYQTEKQTGLETEAEQSYEFEMTTTESYATSDDESAVGRDASVVVGSGISTQYGLQRRISFDDNCTAESSTLIGYGLGDFQSSYVYTVGFMEGLVDKYEKDINLIENGLLELVQSDGTILSEDMAVAKTESLRDSWESVIHYFDVETSPHYVLCSDDKVLNDMTAGASASYQGWRDAFCPLIGSYENGKFVMDDEIEWSQDLINAYNNTIAFTENIKTSVFVNALGSELDVDNYDLTDGSLSLTQIYNSTLGADQKSAQVLDISGGSGGYTRTVESQQSSYSNYSLNQFSSLESAGGFYLNVAAGFEFSGVEFQIFTSENSIGYRSITETSIGSSAENSEGDFSEITYSIADDDPEDQVTALILQAPMKNHSPYFIRLGGQSSCPYETALTPNQDNDPLMVDAPDINVKIGDGSTKNPPKIFNVLEGEVAVFEIEISSQSAIFQDRNIEVFLDGNSNPLGAIIKLGGTTLNDGNKIITDVPAFGSITQFLTVERPAGTPFFDFDNISIGARPECDGDAEYINISVQFKSQCSPVSLFSPIDDFVVNRSNEIENLEVIPFEMRDYRVDYPAFQNIQLQYRKIGDGSGWNNVPGGFISKQVLADDDAGDVAGTDPSYLLEWDITGQYQTYPDGEYEVRAESFCGTTGIKISNEVNGELRRAINLFQGYAEPTDGVWTDGDDISGLFVSDINCQQISETNDLDYYIQLIDLTTDTAVDFTYTCINDQIVVTPSQPMSDFDGHVLEVSFNNIVDLNGNEASNIVHQFEVITQDVDWLQDSVHITVYENQITGYDISILNTTGSIVTNLELENVYPSNSWLGFTPAGNFSVLPEGMVVSLLFDSSLPLGTYDTELKIEGLTGRVPIIPIKMTVLAEPVVPLIDPTLPDSMRIRSNWRFLGSEELSIDTLDIIYAYIDDEVRGVAQIQKQGPFFVADLYVYGDEVVDFEKVINFAVFNADEGLVYDNVDYAVIEFESNLERGSVADPEVLIVDEELFDLGPDNYLYVDFANPNPIRNGSTWEKAFWTLEEALDIATDGDTIWIAKGTYYPTATEDRSVSYQVDKSVAIYGGFVSGDTDPIQRVEGNATVLSGNIASSVDNDNSYHVVNIEAEDVVLDNLTITDGNANGVNADSSGAGIINTGSARLVNIKMNNNQSLSDGSCIHNTGSLVLVNGIYTNQSSTIMAILNNLNATLRISGDVRIEQD